MCNKDGKSETSITVAHNSNSCCFFLNSFSRSCLSFTRSWRLSLSPTYILTPQSVLPCGLITARGWRAGTVLFSVISRDCLMWQRCATPLSNGSSYDCGFSCTPASPSLSNDESWLCLLIWLAKRFLLRRTRQGGSSLWVRGADCWASSKRAQKLRGHNKLGLYKQHRNLYSCSAFFIVAARMLLQPTVILRYLGAL